MKFFPLFFLLLLLSCSRSSHVIVLYFNDAHEISPVIDSRGERGGVARLKTVVDKIRHEEPNTLVVFGGDLAGGSLFGGFYHGFPMVDAFNHFPVDLANFGQHDFDFGVDNARRLVDSSDFQWLTSNLLEADSSVFHTLPQFLIRRMDGVKMVFIGLTDAMNTTTANDLIQLDIFKAAGRVLEKLHDADMIIAITQTSPDVNETLLSMYPQIDAILTEERSENRSHVFYVGDRPVISPCGNMGSVARLDIRKHNRVCSLSTNVLPVDSTLVDENPELFSIQQKYQNSLDSTLSAEIASTKTLLDAGINTHFRCRWAESNIGNLVTDAYRDYYHANLAVINGGCLRANILVGAITTKNILAVLPFGNKVCLVEMSGRAIWDMLEHGVSNIENLGGQFLQISGGRYAYDPGEPAGKRIKSVSIQNDNLDFEKKYTVALPDYVLFGGNDFNIQANIIVNADNAPIDFEVVCDFIKGKILNQHLQGRIRLLEED